MATVFPKLKAEGKDMQIQYLAEEAAGNRQVKVLNAILNNWQSVDTAIQSANNSSGSALKENEKYLNSINGKLSQLSSAWQKASVGMIDSNLIKTAITDVTKLISTFGNLKTVISMVGTGLLLWKGADIWKSFKSLPSDITKACTSLIEYGRTAQFVKLTEQGMTAEAAEAAVATKGLSLAFTGLGQSIKASFMSNPLGWIAMGITTAISVIDIFNQKQEEAKQKTEEKISKLTEESTALNDLRQQYTEIISSGDLTSESKERLKGIQDQLLKTYGLEVNLLEEVNGKYKDQSKIIDEAFFKKQNDLKKTMQSEALNAQDQLINSKSSKIKIDAPFDTDGDYDKIIKEFEDKYKDAFKWYRTSAFGKISYEINGTLEQRVKILDELSDRLSKVSENNKSLTDASSSATSEYNKLNNALIKNQETWSKYAEADFYTKYKEQISQVHDLQNKLANESDSNKKSDIQNQIDGIKNSITSSKGYLTDYNTYVSDLFNNTSKSADNVANSAEKAAAEALNFSSSLSSINEKFNLLSSVQKEFNDNGVISAKTLEDMSKQYPQLNTEISKYIAGIIDEKDLIASLSDVYKTDENNYIKLVQSKLMNDVDFMNNLGQNKKDQIKDLADSYGVDLNNFTTVEQLKLSVQSKILTSMKGNLEKYNGYSIEGLKTERSDLVRRNAGGKYSGLIDELNGVINSYEEIDGKLKGVVFEGYNFTPKKFEADTGKGSSADKTSTSNDNLSSSTKDLSVSVDDLTDRYQRLNAELSAINKQLDLNSKLQESASGQAKIDLISKQNELLRQQQDVYSRIEEEKRKDATTKFNDLYGNGFRFDKKGLPTNYNEVMSNATAVAEAMPTNSEEESEAKKNYANYLKAIQKEMQDYLKLVDEISDAQSNWRDSDNKIIANLKEQKQILYELSQTGAKKYETALSDVQDALSDVADDDYQGKLQANNNIIAKATDLTNYWRGELDKFKDVPDKQEEINNKLKEYSKDIKTATKNIKELNDAENQRKYDKWYSGLEKEKSDAQELLNTYTDGLDKVESKLKDVHEKQYKHYEDLANKRKKQLEDEKEEFTNLIDSNIKNMEREREAENYNKDIGKASDEINDIQKDINKYSAASSSGDLEAISKVNDLNKSLKEKQDALAEKQDDHAYDMRKQNLEDSKEDYEKYIKNVEDMVDDQLDKYKDELEKMTDDTSLEMQAIALLNGYTVNQVTQAAINGTLDVMQTTKSNASTAQEAIADLYHRLGIGSQKARTEMIDLVNLIPKMVEASTIYDQLYDKSRKELPTKLDNVNTDYAGKINNSTTAEERNQNTNYRKGKLDYLLATGQISQQEYDKQIGNYPLIDTSNSGNTNRGTVTIKSSFDPDVDYAQKYKDAYNIGESNEKLNAILDKMYAKLDYYQSINKMSAAEVAERKKLFPKLPAYATGTLNALGGLSLVGEKGAEIVNLPKGSGVLNHIDTEKLLSLIKDPTSLVNSYMPKFNVPSIASLSGVSGGTYTLNTPITLNVSGSVDESIIPKIVSAVQQEQRREMNRAGIHSRTS